MVSREQVTAVRERITDEIFAAWGMSKRGLLRRLFGWLFYLPTSRFAGMFACADEAAAEGGLGAGCRVVINHLAVNVQASGVENLQGDGPLMIVSNHPGAYDSAAIGSQVTRTDFSIIAGDVPLYYALVNIRPHLIFVPTSTDTSGRMLTLRKAIDHLKSGGSLLQFGGGTIEPDPAVQPGASEWLSRWSPSVEIMLRKAPETRLVLAVASGVLMKRFFQHPLSRLRRQPVARRRAAEFMQVMAQLAARRPIQAEMQLRFAPPVSVAELTRQANGGRLMPVLIEHERRLLAKHAAAEGLMI